MKVMTSELSGAALDWAVGQADECDLAPVEYSTRWEFGGPIIEREVITLIHPRWDCWTAHKYDERDEEESYTLDGVTPLIAAMRVYVASKLGDKVEVPDELLQGEAMGQLKQQHTDWDNEHTPEPPLTRDEILKAALYWERHGGSFHQSLGKALIAADKDNLAALLTGFENQIRNVLRYQVEHI